MSCRILPTVETLRERLEYNPENGVILRKARPRSDFTHDRHFGTWNTRFCGKVATSEFKGGYLSVQIDGQNRLAHRVAFALYHGKWPEGQIDHINGIRDDNRIENLREVDNATNSRNTGVRKNNTTGVVGVKHEPRNTNKPWVAGIKFNGASIHLGSYASKQEAIQVRKDAEKKYMYHSNHGNRSAVAKDSRR